MTESLNDLNDQAGLPHHLGEMADHIRHLIECPSAFICDYFAELRNSIDLHAETFLANFSTKTNASECNEINRRRSAMIDEISKQEDFLQSKFLASDFSAATETSREKCEGFKMKIEGLVNAQSMKNRDEFDLAFDDLYWELIAETKRLESAIMSNQSLIFNKNFKPMATVRYDRGLLIHIDGYYLRSKSFLEDSKLSFYFSYVS